MCGLIGVASSEGLKHYSKRRDAFVQGLQANSFRGDESTGIALVGLRNEKSVPEIYKKAMAGWDFVQLAQFGKYMVDFEKYAMVLGHNRAATRGTANDGNAHPFNIRHITLTHNGTITNNHALGVGDMTKTFVDSEAIAAALAKHGEAEALSKLDGSYSLVWHNAEDGSLNFARNEARPMYWQYIKDENTLFWGSEWQMLYWLLTRAGIELPLGGKFRVTNPHVHYKMFMNDLRVVDRRPFPKYVQPPFRHSPNYHGYGGERGADWRSRTEGQGGTTAIHANTTTATTSGNATTDTTAAEEVGISNHQTATFREVFGKGILELTPKERKKYFKISRKLKDLGLSLLQRFMVDVKTFHPYKGRGQPLGLMKGRMAYKAFEVEFPSVKTEDWRDSRKMGQVWARAINVYRKNGDPTVVAVLDEADLSNPSKHPLLGDRTWLMGPNGQLISSKRWQELTEGGCANCSSWINPQFAKETKWFGDPAQPLCHFCSGDKDVLDAVLSLDAEKHKPNVVTVN